MTEKTDEILKTNVYWIPVQLTIYVKHSGKLFLKVMGEFWHKLTCDVHSVQRRRREVRTYKNKHWIR